MSVFAVKLVHSWRVQECGAVDAESRRKKTLLMLEATSDVFRTPAKRHDTLTVNPFANWTMASRTQPCFANE
jgi:hypothetical protein